MKATFLALLAVSVALALPGLSLADETPNPAISACKAEYVQLGAAGFVSKYGAGESFGACLRAHGVTTTPAGDATPADGIAARLCEIEYKQSGAEAFAAKYGVGEAAKHACLRATTPQAQAIVAHCQHDEACIKVALGITTGDGNATEKPKAKPHADGATGVAAALCVAEAKTLGKDAFRAKYGHDGLEACVKANLAEAGSIVAACKSSSASSKDAFKHCVVDALKTAAAH